MFKGLSNQQSYLAAITRRNYGAAFVQTCLTGGALQRNVNERIVGAGLDVKGDNRDMTGTTPDPWPSAAALRICLKPCGQMSVVTAGHGRAVPRPAGADGSH